MRMFLIPPEAFVLSMFLWPFFVSANNIDCSHVRVKSKDFDLSPLGGPRSVLHSVDEGLSFKNTTYTIDICRSLTRKKDVPKEHQCPLGTRVCAIERLINKEEDKDILEAVIPIAGDLKDKGGSDLEAKWELLSSTSSSHEDAQKDGIRVNMNGGFAAGQEKRPQKAIVEFLCDPKRTGLENLWTPEEEDQYEDGKEKREEKTDDDDDDANKEKEKDAELEDKDKPSLEFVAYDVDAGAVDILRLRWHTKHACVDAKKKLDEEKGQQWGFFTWFILIAFLSTASYLIFGSWLNYNRYGARGWDLLPHGDTIRDVPYLLKDWSRRVLNTLQGPGSRGGYAAV